ncbi:aspartate dehydrogenase domain-containing protein [Agrobacterium albertimagni]|nr:aspartate dehydrogenase domain-containing protein [Agrobacterium albertimagni]
MSFHPTSERLGIIGFGAIGARLARFFASAEHGPRTSAILVRDRQLSNARAVAPEATVCTNFEEFLEASPSVVAECASANTLATLGPLLLKAGCDVVPLSLGAFADERHQLRLYDAAASGPGRLEIPAGALGSIGFLAGAREHELEKVTVTVAYPTKRWKSMGALRFIDLDQVLESTAFLEASAREVARLFPGHLNVVTGAALAGLGLDRTHVILVADPTIPQAWFQIDAISGSGPITIRVDGRNATVDEDPIDHTSFSVIRLLKRRCASVAI